MVVGLKGKEKLTILQLISKSQISKVVFLLCFGLLAIMSSHLNWEFNDQLINGGREIDCSC